jgi:phosphatidylserine decarboxylase
LRIVRDGIPYILTPLAVSLVLLVLGYWYIALFFVVITGFMCFFFRDPKREPPEDPNVIVSPADGRVMHVTALGRNGTNSSTLISIFLSPLDVHINRAPIAGKVVDVAYTRGKFLMATNNDASLINEQNTITIEGSRITIACKQIAGILARRIVCWKSKGDHVTLGERFGLIKFSSRTDLILPENVEVLVTKGMHVQGGVTIVGRIRG